LTLALSSDALPTQRTSAARLFLNGPRAGIASDGDLHHRGAVVIDPEECIDCGACEPECPVEAIFPEDVLPAKWSPFVRVNYAYGEGLAGVDQLVDELRGEDDGASAVREPRDPPPDAPGGTDAVEPPRS
jgi:NAD-dependent dihydropyrimidine dehydrogenase PreA subunit